MAHYTEHMITIPLREGDLVRIAPTGGLDIYFMNELQSPGSLALVMEHVGEGALPFTGTTTSDREHGRVYIREVVGDARSVTARTRGFRERGWEMRRADLELIIPAGTPVPNTSKDRRFPDDIRCFQAEGLCENGGCCENARSGDAGAFVRDVLAGGDTNPLLVEDLIRSFIRESQQMHGLDIQRPIEDEKGKNPKYVPPERGPVTEYKHVSKDDLLAMEKDDIVDLFEQTIATITERLHSHADRRQWCSEYEEALVSIQQDLPDHVLLDPNLAGMDPEDPEQADRIERRYDIVVKGVIPFESKFELYRRSAPSPHDVLGYLRGRSLARLVFPNGPIEQFRTEQFRPNENAFIHTVSTIAAEGER